MEALTLPVGGLVGLGAETIRGDDGGRKVTIRHTDRLQEGGNW